MAHLDFLTNDYADTLGDLYEKMPKSLLAAIAVSALTTGGDHINEARERVAHEWVALYQNGIVKQKPTKEAIELAGRADALDRADAPDVELPNIQIDW